MVLAEDLDALDPQRGGRPSSWTLLRAMHRGLMAFPAAGAPDPDRPVPDLAAAPPEVSADGLRYTFRLRNEIAFGPPVSRPVVANDVKAGLERIFTVRSPVAWAFTIIAGADAFAAGKAPVLSGVTTPDDHTVVIALARPANDLPWLLALPAASAVPPGLGAVIPAEQIPASGPYRLADRGGYVPERSIHLVRNDAWKPDSDPVRGAWVDEVTVEIGVAPAEAQKRLIAGTADLSGDVPPGEVPANLATGRVLRAPNGCLRYLFVNTRVAPLSSQPVRTAVSLALDRAAIANTYAGAALPAATILPPTVDGSDSAKAVPPANSAAAREALAPTSFKSGFSVKLVVGDQEIDKVQAAAVRTALAAAGIKITVETVPIATLYEGRYEVARRLVPMGIATWCADWPGLGGRAALAPLVDGRGAALRSVTNYSGVSVPAMHSLLDAAALERDPARAAQRWREADAYAVRLATVVPLAFLQEVLLLGPDVRGFTPHPYFVRGDLCAVWLDRG